MCCNDVEWICVAHGRFPVFDRFHDQFSSHREDIVGFLVVSLRPLSAHSCIQPRTSPGPLPSAFPISRYVYILLPQCSLWPFTDSTWKRLNGKKFGEFSSWTFTFIFQLHVNLYFCTLWKRMVEWRCIPHILNPWSGRKRVVALTLRLLHSQGKRPLYTLNRRLIGPWLDPRTGLNDVRGRQNSWDLCLCGKLRSVDWQVVTDGSEQPVGPETSVTTHVLCVTSRKNHNFSYTAVAACDRT